MPNGRSMIGAAAEMTLSVAKGLGDTHASMQEYLQHLQNRKAQLEALLQDSHQDDVREMIAEVDAAIDALKISMNQVQEGADRATKIEARL